jgi:hypothetical protein
MNRWIKLIAVVVPMSMGAAAAVRHLKSEEPICKCPGSYWHNGTKEEPICAVAINPYKEGKLDCVQKWDIDKDCNPTKQFSADCFGRVE